MLEGCLGKLSIPYPVLGSNQDGHAVLNITPLDRINLLLVSVYKNFEPRYLILGLLNLSLGIKDIICGHHQVG
jgi:hypothetical protein